MCQKPGTLYLHVCYGVLGVSIGLKYNLSLAPVILQAQRILPAWRRGSFAGTECLTLGTKVWFTRAVIEQQSFVS